MKTEVNDRQQLLKRRPTRWGRRICGFAAIVVLLIGCTSVVAANGADAPSQQEVKQAQADGDQAQPQVATAPNAQADENEEIGDASAGEVDYADDCAMCHGDTGAGDGPAGAAFDLPDFSDGDYMADVSDDHLYQVIDEGNGNMPGFGNSYSEQQIYDVIAYIRTFAE